MRQGKYARTTNRGLSKEGSQKFNRIWLPKNSVCVSCIGWQMGEVIMTDKLSITNQQINSIIPNDKVDPSFLYYSLVPRKQELLSLGTMAGSRTPILNKSSFSDVKIRIPKLAVQKYIAGILSSIDELIENYHQQTKILRSMSSAIFCEWFTNFRFPGHEYSSLVETQDGKIPKGWEIRKVSEFAEFIRGIEPGSNAYEKEPTKGRIKFLRVGDLSKRKSGIYR